MSGDRDSTAPQGDIGCLAAGALFAVVFVAVWLAAMTLYGLVVEQWGLIGVRREFSYDWALGYAPLLAIGCGTAAAFIAARRVDAARVTVLTIVIGLIALFGGVLLFGLGGLI